MTSEATVSLFHFLTLARSWFIPDDIRFPVRQGFYFCSDLQVTRDIFSGVRLAMLTLSPRAVASAFVMIHLVLITYWDPVTSCTCERRKEDEK